MPIAAARRLLADTSFELVEVAPGLARLFIVAADYRETTWGPCHERPLGFFVRLAGRPDQPDGLYVHRFPVDEAFTCVVGKEVMGYPVRIELIDVQYTPEDVTFRLAVGVQPCLELRLPRKSRGHTAERCSMACYGSRDGVPFRMPMEMDTITGMVDPGTIELTLGSGPLADELRALGLPQAPEICVWGEGVSAKFDESRPIDPIEDS